MEGTCMAIIDNTLVAEITKALRKSKQYATTFNGKRVAFAKNDDGSVLWSVLTQTKTMKRSEVWDSGTAGTVKLALAAIERVVSGT
jgi:hypothetical protein